MSLPAGPATPPAIQVIRWIRSPFRVMEEGHARFGDAFTMRLAGMPGIVIVADPLAVKDVFGLGPDEAHAGKETFPVHVPMQEITLQIILRTVFGVDEGPRFTELADALKGRLDATKNPIVLFPFMQHDLGPLSPWGRFRRHAGLA